MFRQTLRILDWMSDMAGWAALVLSVSLLLSRISAEPADNIEKFEQRIDARVIELSERVQ